MKHITTANQFKKYTYIAPWKAGASSRRKRRRPLQRQGKSRCFELQPLRDMNSAFIKTPAHRQELWRLISSTVRLRRSHSAV